MDDALGIVRKDTNAASKPQSIGAAITPDVQQSRKRAMSSDDNSEESTTRPGPKRVRLFVRPRDDANDEEAHVADGGAGASAKDKSTLLRQPISSNEVQEPVTVDKVTSVKVHTQASVGEVPFANGETNTRDDTAADDEAAPSRKEWNTAHGINSNGANIRVPGMGVFDLTGEWANFYLPTSRTSSPSRPLTGKEKEDLRVYIQDYGVQNWKVLAKSMNRTVGKLHTEYLEYIKARNIQAGRGELAGIPPAFPNLAPPPPPPPLPNPDEPTAAPDSADPAATSEPARSIAAPEPAKPEIPVMAAKLRPRAKKGKVKNNNLGDLKYDLKAQSFPRITKDGGMVDARGNALLGIMDKLPARSY